MNDLTPETAENQETAEGQPSLSEEEARPVVEALLFATTEPMSLARIAGIMPGIPQPALRRVIAGLQASYDEEGRGIQIVEVAGGWQMATRKQHAPYLEKLFHQKKRTPLSPSALETLAIIAYKQPIIRAEIEAIRGVDSSGVIRALSDAGLVRIVGKKDVIGHPSLYGTTDDFLRVFGLRRLADLPSIRDLRRQMELKEAEKDADKKGA